jgi:hypothetical protein
LQVLLRVWMASSLGMASAHHPTIDSV